MQIETRMETHRFVHTWRSKRVKYLTCQEAQQLKFECRKHPLEIRAIRVQPRDIRNKRAFYKIVDEINDKIYYIAVPLYIGAKGHLEPGRQMQIELETFDRIDGWEMATVPLEGIEIADYNEHIRWCLQQYGIADPDTLDMILEAAAREIQIEFTASLYIEETEDEEPQEEPWES